MSANRNRTTHNHPEGIQVDLFQCDGPGLGWCIRHRGRELARGGGFRPSPLIDPMGQRAAADLAALALHSLVRDGQIREGDPAQDAARLFVLDFEEGGRS